MTRTQTRANALLGYPDDARLLILNADDLGMCYAVNEAILETFRVGGISSCTLMAPCPWSLHALKLLRATPELPFGVHLTVISEAPDYRWGPSAAATGCRRSSTKQATSTAPLEPTSFWMMSR